MLKSARILYVGAGAPWMGGSGYLLRQATTLRALAGLGTLHLALFHLPPDAPPPPYAAQVTPLDFRPLPVRGKLHRAFHDLFNPLPRLTRHTDLASARLPLDPAAIDMIVAYRIDFAHAAGVLRGWAPSRLILDVDDAEHLRWRRRMNAQKVVIDWRTERDLEKLRRFECTAVAGAAQAWVCQENDRKAFPRGQVLIVPNGVHVPAQPRRHPVAPVILLLGNFKTEPSSPNADALRWFAAEVWSRVRALVPAAQCRVAGNMNDDMHALIASSPGMRAIGFVEALEPAFAEASLSVAPLRFGTGTRIKILDAWAHACPVVSTTAGADGLPAASGQNILIADRPQDFANRCAQLLTDAPLAAAIGEAGYRTAAQHFNADAIQHRMTGLFRDFLARAPRAR